MVLRNTVGKLRFDSFCSRPLQSQKKMSVGDSVDRNVGHDQSFSSTNLLSARSLNFSSNEMITS